MLDPGMMEKLVTLATWSLLLSFMFLKENVRNRENENAIGSQVKRR